MADERIHGTTHERPSSSLRARRSARRCGRCRRGRCPCASDESDARVATDCFVDVDTVRYSVPHRLVRRSVEVLVGDDEVVIFDGDAARRAPRALRTSRTQRVVDPAHFEGLCA